MLREELQLLQEQGSYVGEVVKPMDKKKVLVKVSQPTCSLCITYIIGTYSQGARETVAKLRFDFNYHYRNLIPIFKGSDWLVG